MIIYVVTEGDYSDYHIITATLEKDKAYKLSSLIDHSRVEEYNSDEYSFIDDRKVYKVEIDRIWENSYPFSKDYNYKLIAQEVHSAWAYESNYGVEFSRGKFITSYIKAKDEEHALKICYDAIAKKKAELIGL